MADPWDIKLERAVEHLAELRRATKELLDSGDIAPVTDQSGTERAVRLAMKREIPGRMSAIVGDIVHNLRSALDTMAMAVCEYGYGGPLPEADEPRVQFPITSTAEHWAMSQRLLPHALDEHREHIRAQQPWAWSDERSPYDPGRWQDVVDHHSLTRPVR